jgi:V8-like Glu-specific endopeptidase
MSSRTTKMEKNLPDPILFKSLSNLVAVKRGKKPKSRFKLRIGSIDQSKNSEVRLRNYLLRTRGRKIDVFYSSNKVGQHSFPPPMKTVPLVRVNSKGRIKKESSGSYPEHLARRPIPTQLPKELQLPKRLWQRKKGAKDELGEPTTVFAPDTRFTFSDTSFPWSTCGRVDTAAGWGSGVLVGPRHVMTASHVVNWGANNTAGWLKFTPSYFDGSAPYGFAYATQTYFWDRANGSDGIDSLETAFDYVVSVLDNRLGDITGWMGSRGYSSSWNGSAFWSHVGYPGDLAGGQRPAFFGSGVMDDTFSQSLSGRSSYGIRHRNDIWPGQSGGPFFAWWDNEPWPRVVSTQSAQNWGSAGGPNTCGGGDPLPELISYALSSFP